jgi:outer membrane protein, heavy metal efflux system
MNNRRVAVWAFLPAAWWMSRVDAACALTTPKEAAACAAREHPLVLAERRKLDAMAGRRLSAATVLPWHPEITFSLADRRVFQPTAGSPTPALNLYATLSQRIELGGQRAVRMSVAESETQAQVGRLALIELHIGADAALAAFRVLTERQHAELAAELAGIGRSLARFAEARAEKALLSTLDADLLLAESSRIGAQAIASAQHVRDAEAEYLLLVGEKAPQKIEDAGEERVPPALEDLERRALDTRHDLRVLRAEKDASLAREKLFSRERVPTIALQVLAQSDGFHERVLGGGITIPLTLPAPLGPSRRGERDEARAQALASDAEHENAKRRVLREVRNAHARLLAAVETLKLHPLARAHRMREELHALTEALLEGKMPVREALFSARALLEYVERSIDAVFDVAEARIALARAAALPLEEVLP